VSTKQNREYLVPDGEIDIRNTTLIVNHFNDTYTRCAGEVYYMFDDKSSTILLGFAFLALLLFSYIANTAFFGSLSVWFQNQPLVFVMIFMNNIIVVSLVLLGMRFYVNLVVLGVFKREKSPDVVLRHPRIFAAIFAFIVLFLGILRGVNRFFGEIAVETLPSIFLASAPIGAIEGYGVYLTIRKTLGRTMTMKNLVYIYGIFFAAAILEISLINIVT